MLKNRFMRQEKGSIAVYAIATILSFIFILSGIFFNSAGIRKNQLRTLIKIKEIYAQEVEVKEITKWEFGYTENAQKWVVPATGYYQLQVWGAQGGGNYGGKGGYSEGIVYLNKGKTIYAYVGGQGTAGTIKGGGFNGGGNPTDNSYYGGGGATDFRVEQDTLYNRIIVAGGGGGTRSSYPGSAGGGTNSCVASNTTDYCMATYATQISGGTSIANGGKQQYEKYLTDGTFGLGGSWIPSAGTLSGFAGGGGGWYGGGGGHYSTGGSGWVYTKENYEAWIEGNSTNEANWKLKGEYYLIKAGTIDGESEMPTHDGTGKMIGNEENGYAIITWKGAKI